MSNQELLEYIGLFREKAEQGKLVIFVGAGVSCNVEGMPDWNSLIQNMAKAIGYSKCTSCRYKNEACEKNCLLKDDYSADEFLKIPQYVFNTDKALYDQVLTESISTMVVDAPLSSAIFDINPVHIITTNYDQLLESSKNVFREQYQVIVSDKDLLNADKSKYIIKMHGDLSTHNIVLKEQDYLDYSQNHVLMELFIKSLLTDHIVLFLGYSLNDYNIKLIISWLNYMRSQNGALEENRKVGYIVLDQVQIDKTQRDYFNCNNIGVININAMPQIQDIPESLSNEKGKRLYSFLRVIADPALEENMSSIESSVQFMSQYNFINYEQILKLLYVKKYDVTDGQLRLLSEGDYSRLTTFMEANTVESDKLKQLFINAGIVSILYFDIGNTKRFSIGEFSQNALLQDRLYNLYILNQYDEIKSLLENNSEIFEPSKKIFYQSIVSGYSEVLDKYGEMDTSELNIEQTVAYLHNSAVVEALKTLRFDSNKVKHFIQNVSTSKERELFSGYLDIYSGNTKKRLAMQTALEKLKKDVCDRHTIHFGGTSCAKIYEIKRIALTQYFFYYNNHILYHGCRDLNDFFKPYIEAIICSNCDVAEKDSHFGDIEFTNEKYPIGYIDLDIITKFISAKDLNAFIETYNVKKLNVDENEVRFLTECLQNLCNSIITAQTYGFRQASFSTFSNLILLLNLVDLDENSKRVLKTTIAHLVSDKTIAHILFSIHWPDFRITLRALSKLCRSLTLSCDFEIVRSIVTRKEFFEYAANVSFGSLRQLITAFLPNDISDEVQTTIDTTDNFNQKIILLRLFYQHIVDVGAQRTYQDFLSVNFLQLPTNAIYDFIFSGWLTLTPETAEAFLKGILEMNGHQTHGVHSFPDPVETKLECAYLLYISDRITDISILKELSEGRPHLQFLLSPENFDYTQVDFSNYMWGNFARNEKYMKYFVSNKDAIIPQIKERIEKNDASEAEKRILYGFLLDKDEVWKI